MRRGRSVPLVLALVCVLGLVIVSPVLMLLAAQYPLPWSRLGDVGQAYGAISAVVSALALLVVSVSLVTQQRQNRTMEEHAVRQRHFDLVRLTMENPKYIHSWGIEPAVDYDPALLGFGNLIVSHWLMLWRIRNIDEPALRRNARTFFAGQVGRDHWRLGGATWPTRDRRSARFVAILNDELRKAEKAGPPRVVPPFRQSSFDSSGRPPAPLVSLTLVGAAALVGGIIGHGLARTISRRPR